MFSCHPKANVGNPFAYTVLIIHLSCFFPAHLKHIHVWCKKKPLWHLNHAYFSVFACMFFFHTISTINKCESLRENVYPAILWFLFFQPTNLPLVQRKVKRVTSPTIPRIPHSECICEDSPLLGLHTGDLNHTQPDTACKTAVMIVQLLYIYSQLISPDVPTQPGQSITRCS